jgi:hypothetical protein
MHFCFLNPSAISASVNQRLFERKFHFISVEKLFSEPKIGSKSGSSSTYQCVANGLLHFVCNTTVGCISYFAIYSHRKHQSARI